MSDAQDPCGNEDGCDLCYPLPRFKVQVRRLQWITYEREVKARGPFEAIILAAEPQAHPSSYDDRYGEVLQVEEPVATLMPAREWNSCYHEIKDFVLAEPDEEV